MRSEKYYLLKRIEYNVSFNGKLERILKTELTFCKERKELTSISFHITRYDLEVWAEYRLRTLSSLSHILSNYLIRNKLTTSSQNWDRELLKLNKTIN